MVMNSKLPVRVASRRMPGTAGGAYGGRNVRMIRGTGRVAHNRQRITVTLNRQRFPRLEALKNGLPGRPALGRPNVEDHADANEEGHQVPQQEDPERRFVAVEDPVLPIVVLVTVAGEHTGCGDDVERGQGA